MEDRKLEFIVLQDTYGVCRLDKDRTIPDWAKESEFFSITKTRSELSLVCSQQNIPEDITCEKGWRVLKVEGTLDFSLTGILASISGTLAAEDISIFAISTYDTDYILVKEAALDRAVEALRKAGHAVFTQSTEEGAG